MRALEYDLVVEQGADFRLTLLFSDSAHIPVNLTGFSAAAQMRTNHAAASVLLAFSSSPPPLATSRIWLGGTAGTVILEADADATRALTFRQGVYDVEVTSPTGEVYRLAEGRVTLSREVTR